MARKRTDPCIACPTQGAWMSMTGFVVGKGLCQYHHLLSIGWSKDSAAKEHPTHPCVTYKDPSHVNIQS